MHDGIVVIQICIIIQISYIFRTNLIINIKQQVNNSLTELKSKCVKKFITPEPQKNIESILQRIFHLNEITAEFCWKYY